MRIEPATEAQSPAIANLISQWNAATPWMPRVHSRVSEKGFARMLVQKGWVISATDQGRVLGFLACETTAETSKQCAQDDLGELHGLYIAPHLRGQGIGKALLDQAKSDHAALGLYTFVANAAAQRFYLREGFTEVGRSDGQGLGWQKNDEGLPDIRYEWRKPQ